MMWAATVFLCLSTLPDCMRFDDVRGPYETRPECEARVYEMVTDLMTLGQGMSLALPRELVLECREIGADGEAV